MRWNPQPTTNLSAAISPPPTTRVVKPPHPLSRRSFQPSDGARDAVPAATAGLGRGHAVCCLRGDRGKGGHRHGRAAPCSHRELKGRSSGRKLRSPLICPAGRDRSGQKPRPPARPAHGKVTGPRGRPRGRPREDGRETGTAGRSEYGQPLLRAGRAGGTHSRRRRGGTLTAERGPGSKELPPPLPRTCAGALSSSRSARLGSTYFPEVPVRAGSGVCRSQFKNVCVHRRSAWSRGPQGKLFPYGKLFPKTAKNKNKNKNP